MDAQIEALLREKEGYRRAGRDDRVAEVDAYLKQLGYKPEKRTADVESAASGDVVEVAVDDKPRRRG